METMHYMAIPGIPYDRDTANRLTNEVILEAVCEYYRVTPDELKTPYRGARVSTLRLVAMFLMKKYDTSKVAVIGSMFHRHYSMVIYAQHQIQDLLDVDTDFRETILNIEEAIHGKIKGKKDSNISGSYVAAALHKDQHCRQPAPGKA